MHLRREGGTDSASFFIFLLATGQSSKALDEGDTKVRAEKDGRRGRLVRARAGTAVMVGIGSGGDNVAGLV